MTSSYIKIDFGDHNSETVIERIESLGYKFEMFASDYVEDLEQFFSKITKESLSQWIDLVQTKSYPKKVKLDLISDILQKK